MAKQRKLRTAFRKNRSTRARKNDVSRELDAAGESGELRTSNERISGKGELTRRRTVIGEIAANDASGSNVVLEVDANMPSGRVLSVHGLSSVVQATDGAIYRCITRRVLRTLATDQRHVVVAGDVVRFLPSSGDEGSIERVEPRRAVLSRTSRRRQHIIVSNVDQLLIITSAAEPYLKPNLIDRFLVSAAKNHLRPVICINKVDLVDPASLQPLTGVYSQMGYEVLLLSAQTGAGLERLRRTLADKASAVAGQSGVGKSSLLNAVDPELKLRVRAVSEDSQKGRHTTTTARLLPLTTGGYVVDTPGIRQFQLWDVVPAELSGYFKDLRPYVNHCRFPNCTHTHEADCAVKNAVADGRCDARRYESYCQLFEGDFV